MKTDIHNKDLALRLILKERPRGTRKWPTEVRSGIEAILLHNGLATHLEPDGIGYLVQRELVISDQELRKFQVSEKGALGPP